MQNFVIDHPMSGQEVFEALNKSDHHFFKKLYFVSSYGCFQFTLLNSKLSHEQDGKIFIHAKFHIIFHDCLNIKQNYSELSQLFDMKFFHSKRDKLLEKVIYVSGYYDDSSTYKELSDYIETLFQNQVCKYCSKLFHSDSCFRTHSLCQECSYLDLSAMRIQEAFRTAYTNPNYEMCQKRIFKEFQEFDDLFGNVTKCV